MPEFICPLCLKRAKNDLKGDSYFVNCNVCGRYEITGSAEATSNFDRINKYPDLSAWIREANEEGREIPVIDSVNFKTIRENLPKYNPVDKQLVFLRNIARRSEFPGKIVDLAHSKDYPLAWAADDAELRFHIDSLRERRLLKLIDTSMSRMIITTEGWTYLDEMTKEVAITDQVFIAMSFDKGLDNVWIDGIKPAVEDAGYKPLRVDEDPHIDRIDAKIITELKNSKFIVADVTEQKQGVYFEAGFAIGLGRPVIWTVNKKDLENVHFDTRQYNHIVWNEPADLREQLYNLICAVIGRNK